MRLSLLRDLLTELARGDSPADPPAGRYERIHDAYKARMRDAGINIDDGIRPHCDSLVIHAPGICRYCDECAPSEQRARETLGICFSEETPTGHKTPCPASLIRPASLINLWGGNVAQTQADIDRGDADMAELVTKFAEPAATGPTIILPDDPIVTYDGQTCAWTETGPVPVDPAVRIGIDTNADGTTIVVAHVDPEGNTTVAGELHTDLHEQIDELHDRMRSIYSVPAAKAAVALDEWLLDVLDAADRTLVAMCRIAGTTVKAAAAAWPDLARQARILDAHRNLVELHTPLDTGRCQRCTVLDDPWGALAPAPCLTLRTVAAVYADQPGYDPAWTVT